MGLSHSNAKRASSMARKGLSRKKAMTDQAAHRAARFDVIKTEYDAAVKKGITLIISLEHDPQPREVILGFDDKTHCIATSHVDGPYAPAEKVTIVGQVKITPLERRALNHIAKEAGNGATTKEAMQSDNMTWFNGAALMEGLGLTWQGAGGLITFLCKKELAFKCGSQKPDKNTPNPSNYCLTDLGIAVCDYLLPMEALGD